MVAPQIRRVDSSVVRRIRRADSLVVLPVRQRMAPVRRGVPVLRVADLTAAVRVVPWAAVPVPRAVMALAVVRVVR